MKEFAAMGTSTPMQWHMATVEWLLIHLITELGVTPHSSRSGHNTQGIMEAYQDILRDLVCVPILLAFLTENLTQLCMSETSGI
jgi:hypothetical protein